MNKVSFRRTDANLLTGACDRGRSYGEFLNILRIKRGSEQGKWVVVRRGDIGLFQHPLGGIINRSDLQNETFCPEELIRQKNLRKGFLLSSDIETLGRNQIIGAALLRDRPGIRAIKEAAIILESLLFPEARCQKTGDYVSIEVKVTLLRDRSLRGLALVIRTLREPVETFDSLHVWLREKTIGFDGSFELRGEVDIENGARYGRASLAKECVIPRGSDYRFSLLTPSFCPI